MTYLSIAAALALFVWSLKRSQAVERTGLAVATARTAMGTLMDPALSDDEKERAARVSSAQLFVHSASIALRLALALTIPALFLAALVFAKILNLPALLADLESWPMIVASTIAVGVILLWKK